MMNKSPGQKGNLPRTRILYIGNKLSKHGYTPTNIETLGPQLAEYFEVFSVSNKKNKVLRLAEMASTIVLRRSKTDLVLIDTYSTTAFKFAKLAGWLAHQYKIPYIPILHGGDLPKMLQQASDSDFEFFRNAKMLLAPSMYLYQLFKQFGFQQLRYLPNNINLQDYSFKPRPQVYPRLLWVRSFHKIYNPNMAIQVLRQLIKDFPAAELCMVGPDKDGSMERAKKLAASLGIDQNVQFVGKMEKSDWHRLAASYDIFLNTTNVDNTPVSVMEAMALGLPVVSTNAGGIPYLVEDGKSGILVPVGDVEAMTGAVRLLIKSPELAQNLVTGGRKLVQSFSWEVVKESWITLVEEVT